MRRTTMLLLAAAAVASASCAVQKQWAAIGGSRSDGTVKMAYEYGGFEQPVVDNSAAFESAKRHCAEWGYSNAKPFEGVTKQCTSYNQYGCVRWRVVATFQCTGTPRTR